MRKQTVESGKVDEWKRDQETTTEKTKTKTKKGRNHIKITKFLSLFPPPEPTNKTIWFGLELSRHYKINLMSLHSLFISTSRWYMYNVLRMWLRCKGMDCSDHMTPNVSTFFSNLVFKTNNYIKWTKTIKTKDSFCQTQWKRKRS